MEETGSSGIESRKQEHARMQRRKPDLVLFQTSRFFHEAIERILARYGRSVWHESVFAQQAKGDEARDGDGEMAQRGGWVDVGNIWAPHGIELFVLVHLTRAEEVLLPVERKVIIPCRQSCVSFEDPTSHWEIAIAVKRREVGDNRLAEGRSLSV
jgi:hypothetical protein